MSIKILQTKIARSWRAITPFLFLATVALAADGAATAPNATVPQNPFGPKPDTAATPPAAQNASGNTPPSGAVPTAADNGFVPTLRAMLLRRFDKNGDGRLDAAELTEARKILSGGQDTRVLTPAQAALANNGPLFGLRPLIDAAELAEINTMLFGPIVPPPNPAADLATLQQSILHHFDKKSDGQLDAAERAAAKAWLEQVIADLDKPTAEKSVTDMK